MFLFRNETFEKNQYFEKALLGKTQRFNALGLSKNGETVDINVTLIPIKNKTSMDIYVIIKNITEFQEQEKELFLSKKTQEVFNELEDICNFYYDAINDLHYFSKAISHYFWNQYRKKLFTLHLNNYYSMSILTIVDRVKNTVQYRFK